MRIGNPIGGFLPEAFELRDGEKGLSVNWLEYFKGTHQKNVEASMQKFRDTIDVKKSSAFGVGNVKKIQGVCAEHGADKVRVLLDELDDNKSHSIIIRLPQDNLALLESLAVDAFVDYVPDSEIPR